MKLTRKTMYGLVAGVAVVALMTNSPKPSEPTAKKDDKKVVTKKANKSTDFDEFDYKARPKDFMVLNETPKNAFKPLVHRTKGGNNGILLAPNVIPSYLTMGEPGWIFTGVAESDGVATAMVENSVTGEGAFLKNGETWKGAKVGGISFDQLTLIGLDGSSSAIRLESTPPETVPLIASSGNQGFQPYAVNPGSLRGPIGGSQNVAVTPERPRNQRTEGQALVGQ